MILRNYAKSPWIWCAVATFAGAALVPAYNPAKVGVARCTSIYLFGMGLAILWRAAKPRQIWLPIYIYLVITAAAIFAAGPNHMTLRVWLAIPQLPLAIISLISRHRNVATRRLRKFMIVALIPMIIVLVFYSVFANLVLYTISGIAWSIFGLIQITLVISAVKLGKQNIGYFCMFLMLTLTLNALNYVVSGTILWRPGTEGECTLAARSADALIRPEFDTSRIAQAYDVLHEPDLGGFIATFKAPANLTLPLWDDPQANGIAVVEIDVDGVEQVTELPLPGQSLPEFLAYAPSRQSIFATVLGIGSYEVYEISTDSYPELEVVSRIEIPFEPHRLFSYPKGIAVLGMEKEFAIYDFNTNNLQPLKSIDSSSRFSPFYGWQDPKTGESFITMLGTVVTVLNPNFRIREGTKSFGFGYISGASDWPYLYASNAVQNQIDIIRRDTLEVVDTLHLSYTPRGLAISPKTGRLYVADWLGGNLHEYDATNPGVHLRTWAAAGGFRSIAVSPDGAWVAGATRCGLVLYDVR